MVSSYLFSSHYLEVTSLASDARHRGIHEVFERLYGPYWAVGGLFLGMFAGLGAGAAADHLGVSKVGILVAVFVAFIGPVVLGAVRCQRLDRRRQEILDDDRELTRYGLGFLGGPGVVPVEYRDSLTSDEHLNALVMEYLAAELAAMTPGQREVYDAFFAEGFTGTFGDLVAVARELG